MRDQQVGRVRLHRARGDLQLFAEVVHRERLRDGVDGDPASSARIASIRHANATPGKTRSSAS